MLVTDLVMVMYTIYNLYITEKERSSTLKPDNNLSSNVQWYFEITDWFLPPLEFSNLGFASIALLTLQNQRIVTSAPDCNSHNV